MQDGRTITKDKYHNDREETAKVRSVRLNELQQQINKLSEAIQVVQGEAERNKERNENEQQVLLKQKEVTTNLKQDHIKITTDIKVAQSRIEDLTNRRSMLRDQIADIL